MIRLGLCCIFRSEPIVFRHTTAKAQSSLSRREQLARISALCLHNARSLVQALEYCADHGIGSFRVNSQLLPLYTHPVIGYRLRELPGGREIRTTLEAAGALAIRRGLRTTFHPDQFVLLNSPSEEITRRSVEELSYQADVAELIAADVVNIHGGGGYGEPGAALVRLRRRIERLPSRIRTLLTIENDDRVWRPAALLPVCADTGTPLVYDAHHHRLLADGMSVEEVTRRAAATWNREPLFHVSSPLRGWRGPEPFRHHDFVRPSDLPSCWLHLRWNLTVELEAKAKEIAVLRLRRTLAKGGVRLR